MINIKLIEASNGKSVTLKEIRLLGNEVLLCRDDEASFPILNEVTEVDIERYFPSEMDGLIMELESVCSAINDNEVMKEHFLEIIAMCRKCKSSPKAQIVMDPFTEKFKLEDGKWVED
jgi:hypothetical protein